MGAGGTGELYEQETNSISDQILPRSQTDQSIQTKEKGEQPMRLREEKNWYMLKPPPIFKQMQGDLTCWANAIPSLLKVKNIANTNTWEILNSYSGNTCIDDDNLSLPAKNMNEVMAEWWIDFDIHQPLTLDTENIKGLLKQKGHFILGYNTNSILSHFVVVYGMGFDSDGEANRKYISVMDPLDGKYKNVRISALNPVWVGTAGRRRYPAPCRNKD